MNTITRVTPTPEHETASTLVQAWDTPMIEALIETYHSWAKVGYPVNDPAKLWELAVSRRRRETVYRLNMAVRDLLPGLPIVVNMHGDSPGAVGYGEVDLGVDETDGFRRVSFGDTYDEVAYQDDFGRTILYQVWYTDDNGTLDIIEFDNIDPDRIACAVRHMYDKWRTRTAINGRVI